MAKLMKCIKKPLANQYLPEPFTLGEKIIYLGEVERTKEHPESFYAQFIRIKRIKSKRLQTVSRCNFEIIKKRRK